MKKIFLTILLIVGFQIISYAYGIFIPLDKLVQDSDLIVVGTLQNVSKHTENGTDYEEGIITVENVIWGNSYTGQQLKLKWQNSFVCPRTEHSADANQKGIWLLKVSNGEAYSDYSGRFTEIEKRSEIETILSNKPISLLTPNRLLNPDEDFTVTLVFRNATDSEKKFPNVKISGSGVYFNSRSKLELTRNEGSKKKTMMPLHKNVIFTSHDSSLIVLPRQEIRIKINIESSYAHGFKDGDSFSLIFKADKNIKSNKLEFYVSDKAPRAQPSNETQSSTKQPSIRFAHKKPQLDYLPFVRALVVFIFSFLLYVWLYKVRNIR